MDQTDTSPTDRDATQQVPLAGGDTSASLSDTRVIANQTDAGSIDADAAHRVPLANRYAGAWLEYNTRVTARHNLTTMYLSAATVLVGLLYTLTDKPLPADPAARVSISQTIYATTFTVPLISIIYALFMYMHDGIMSGLHAYMRDCEVYGNRANPLPSYHHGKYNDIFFKYRWLQNAISSSLILIFCLAAIFRADANMSKSSVIIYFLFTIASIWITIWAYFVRRREAPRERPVETRRG